MNVRDFETEAAFFRWDHVQAAYDMIDWQVFRISMDFARKDHGHAARPCPECSRPAADLFWLSVESPDADWAAGRGQVGFLTLCEGCRRQVDFLVDDELTQMAADDRAAR